MMLKSPGKSGVAYLWGWGYYQGAPTKQIESSDSVHNGGVTLAVDQFVSAVKSRELVLVLSSLSFFFFFFYIVQDLSQGSGTIQSGHFFLYELK